MSDNELPEGANGLAASGQRAPDAAGHPLAVNVAADASLQRIVEAWPLLPPHIRETILTLVDATGIGPGKPTQSASMIEQTAWEAAQRCRYVVQGCLREEEWKDADDEFYAVILEAFG